MPAPSVVLLQQGWGSPGLQDEIHLVLLAPGQRLAQHLPCLVDVEVAGAQEAQDVFILGDLPQEKPPGSGLECSIWPAEEAAQSTHFFYLLKLRQQILKFPSTLHS